MKFNSRLHFNSSQHKTVLGCLCKFSVRGKAKRQRTKTMRRLFALLDFGTTWSC